MAHTVTDTHETEPPHEPPHEPQVELPVELNDSRLTPVDSRVRRARELKSQTRAHILVAIRKVFAERGFYGASMNELLVAAGVARGTFHLHFDSSNLVKAGDVSQMARRALGLFKEAALMLAFASPSALQPPLKPAALAREVLDLVLPGVLARPGNIPTTTAPTKKGRS